jgi:hypothetical protein
MCSEFFLSTHVNDQKNVEDGPKKHHCLLRDKYRRELYLPCNINKHKHTYKISHNRYNTALEKCQGISIHKKYLLTL